MDPHLREDDGSFFFAGTQPFWDEHYLVQLIVQQAAFDGSVPQDVPFVRLQSYFPCQEFGAGENVRGHPLAALLERVAQFFIEPGQLAHLSQPLAVRGIRHHHSIVAPLELPEIREAHPDDVVHPNSQCRGFDSPERIV